MKRTSFVLTLLTTLILVGCTATPSPTLVATVSTEELSTPVMTGTPAETLLPIPTLTIPMPTATLTVSPLPSLLVATPTIASTHTVPFAPGSVIFTQAPKSNASEPGPGWEIVNNLFWAVPDNQPNTWSITPLSIGLVAEIHPSPDEKILAMRYIDNFQVEQLAFYSLWDGQLYTISGTEKFADLFWWPDGQTVLYAKSANLFSVDTNDLSVEALTDNPSPIDGEPYTHFAHLKVSPNGQWIATNLIKGVGLPDNRFLPMSWELQLFSNEQQEYIFISDNVGSNFIHLDWSQNSNLLAFTHEYSQGLYVYDLYTSELLTVGSDLTRFYFSDWSPTRDLLAYTQNTVLTIWDSVTRAEQEIFSTDYISEPFWSPDGNFVAIGFGSGERAGILLIDPETNEQREYLLGFPVDWIRWSPDGQWLIYPNGTGLHVLSIADGSTHALLPSDEEMTPPRQVLWLSPTP